MNPAPPGAGMMDVPLTLAALLDRAERQFPAVESVARERPGVLVRFSYADLAARARALSGLLVAAGVAPGDRVATLLWNRRAHLEAYFGVPAAGAVLTTLNLRQHPLELERILRHSGARWLLSESGFLPVARQLQHACALDRLDLVDAPDWDQSLAAAPPPPNPTLTRAAEDAPAALCYTSGTTGAPKGVLYSHRALVLHSLVTALPDALGLSSADTVMPLVPMFHANGWGIPYTATMVGARQVLPGPHPDPVAILDLLSAERVTFAAGVPMIWSSLLDALERDPKRWPLHPQLRVNLGGAPAPLALFRRFDAAGIRVHMGWGMTEITPVGAINPHFDVAAGEARTRQGRPLPLVQARARALDTGREIARNDLESGELEVRGPFVAAAYFGAAAPAADGPAPAWTDDGWFRTGDMVTLDAAGLIRIVDRRRDMIRSGGEWISSLALELALAAHPHVREAAVVAVPDPRWEQRPLAVVVLRADVAAAEAASALRAHLALSFAGWQIPDRFVFIPELPRTGTGKVDKREITRQFLGNNSAERAT